jgi:hypothetical protein
MQELNRLGYNIESIGAIQDWKVSEKVTLKLITTAIQGAGLNHMKDFQTDYCILATRKGHPKK